MKTPHSTQGSAMIIVVLFTLLLLSGILLSTLQLGLTSRQNTADQAAVLKAQYAAESGVSLLRSKLRDLQKVLSAKSDRGVTYLSVPRGTTRKELRGWVERLCGSANWQPLSSFPVESSDPAQPAQNYPGAQSCDLQPSTDASQFVLLAKLVQPVAYQELPDPPGSSEAERLQFWNDWFQQTQETNADGVKTSLQVRPLRVLRLDAQHYRIYWGVTQGEVAASEGQTQRILSLSRTTRANWWTDVELPSLLKNTLLTDFHTTKAGSVVYFNEQKFEGPIRTNGRFMFDSGANMQLVSSVTSSGCTNRAANDCAPSMSVGVGGQFSTEMAGTEEQRNAILLNKVLDGTNNGVQFKVPPDFAGSYLALPENANEQAAAAQGLDSQGYALPEGKGLDIGTALGAELFAGDSAGTPLSSYDPVNRRWQEPTPTYQYIRLVSSLTEDCSEKYYTDYNGENVNEGRYSDGTNHWNCKRLPTYGDLYRVDRQGRLTRQIGTAWSAAGTFNGVLYAANGFQYLAGPGRDAAGQARPALASFSKITVAAKQDIRIKNDLTLAAQPCRLSEYSTLNISPKCADRENVLGIYSQQGDVWIDGETPDNLKLHAMLMSSEGEVKVENFATRSASGDITVLGGVIEKYYGPFGLVGSPGKGFGRDFSYDERLQEGLAPPFFPVSPSWAVKDASKLGIHLDDLAWKQVSASLPQ